MLRIPSGKVQQRFKILEPGQPSSNFLPKTDYPAQNRLAAGQEGFHLLRVGLLPPDFLLQSLEELLDHSLQVGLGVSLLEIGNPALLQRRVSAQGAENAADDSGDGVAVPAEIRTLCDSLPQVSIDGRDYAENGRRDFYGIDVNREKLSVKSRFE